jgi:hypothetical protein
MRSLALSFALLSALLSPTLADSRSVEQNKVGAQYAPVPGAGLPLVALIGILYGVYWIVRRRRRKP